MGVLAADSQSYVCSCVHRYIGSKGHGKAPLRPTPNAPLSVDDEQELRQTLVFLERQEVLRH